MTKEEIKHMVTIMSRADGGCGSCVYGLIDGFVEIRPGYIDTIFEALKETDGYWVDELDYWYKDMKKDHCS